MNNQEAFDKVVDNLLSMKSQSTIEPSGACAYRGSEGKMCAIGCLIPDNLYDPKMERYTLIYMLMNAFPEVGRLFEDVYKLMLEELQNIHDDDENWRPNDGGLNSYGIEGLKGIATTWHLERGKLNDQPRSV